MEDHDKTKQQLLDELAELRRRLSDLEAGNGRADGIGHAGPEGSFWQSLVANTPAFIIVLDCQGRIRFANHTDSGVPPDRLVGRSVYEFCRPEDLDNVRACVEAVIRTGKPGHCHGPALRLDQEEHWYESHLAPIFENGNLVGASLVSINVTERRRAAEELRRSEQTLRTLMDASPESILLLDVDGTILFANETTARRLGRPVGEIIGRTAYDIFPSDVAVNRMRRFEEAARTGKAVRFEDVRIDRHVENVICPILDERGKTASVAVLGIDQTDRKLAEEALKRAHDALEERVKERTAELQRVNEELAVFRKFAEASGQGFGMADMDGLIVYANPALCRLAGAGKPEELLGKRLADYYPEEYLLRRQKEILPVLLREGHWEGEVAVSTVADTEYVLQNSFLIRAEDGNPSRLASVITDITERKRIEQALRETCDQLETIYDHMIEGLLLTDIETKRFVRVNASICRMLGYSKEELLASSIKDIHPPEELPSDLQRFQAAAEGRIFINEDRPVRRKDASIFYADIAASPISYKGRPCLLALFRDVTERKHAEETLKEHNAALQEYAAAATRINERLRKEEQRLQNLMELQDRERQLIGFEIHDELAQLLTGAMMQLQSFCVLREQKPAEAGGKFDTALELLARGIDEARRLINGLRPPSLDEAGVVDAIADMVQEMRARDPRQIEFNQTVDFDRLPRQLENTIFRIVQESLANACRHSHSDRVRIGLSQQGNRLKIEVQDWGIGFEPECVKDGRFGLESIRERARVFGGQATIESRPGQGTRILAELPLPADTSPECMVAESI